MKNLEKFEKMSDQEIRRVSIKTLQKAYPRQTGVTYHKEMQLIRKAKNNGESINPRQRRMLL